MRSQWWCLVVATTRFKIFCPHRKFTLKKRLALGWLENFGRNEASVSRRRRRCLCRLKYLPGTFINIFTVANTGASKHASSNYIIATKLQASSAWVSCVSFSAIKLLPDSRSLFIIKCIYSSLTLIEESLNYSISIVVSQSFSRLYGMMFK